MYVTYTVDGVEKEARVIEFIGASMRVMLPDGKLAMIRPVRIGSEMRVIETVEEV